MQTVLPTPPGMKPANPQPTINDVPSAPAASAVPEPNEGERRKRKPRMNPPPGGFKDFPVEGFDPERFSFPTKEDFNQDAPYYERFKLKEVQQKLKELQRRERAINRELKLWDECGNNAELVAQKRNEHKLLNTLRDNAHKYSKEHLEVLAEILREQGVTL